MKPAILPFGLVLAAATATLSTAPTLAAPVDYLREVKPILAENCYRCHGASQQKHGLRLDTAASARTGGENGPAFKPGQSASSLLVEVIKGQHHTITRMPYKKAPLSDAQIALISRWIDEGAQAPADEQPEKSIHWAFVPPQRPPVPSAGRNKASGVGSTQNPIDAFLLARLAKEKISPSPEADRVTLLRRLSLDLTGLPPTLAEVDAFLQDRGPDSYTKVVERLLASPHFGERWGRHWLDVARYADSNGYSIDAPRSIWKYRDWVINALNRDVPFDQFTIEQLAGDLLPQPTLDQKVATGFNRNTQINQEGGIDPEQFRVESVMDRVNTTATAWLGVTLACAQCHDHKFDPFTQREYYQFYAYFNSTIEDGHGKGAPEGMLEIPGENEATENLAKELEEAEADLDRFLDTKGSEVVAWEKSLPADDEEKLKPEVKKALKVEFARRTQKQKRVVYAAFRPEDMEFKQRNAKVTKLERNQPKPVTTLVMRELDQPRETHIFTKGDFTRPAAVVQPGVPAILNAIRAAAPATHAPSGNRLDLARWLVDPANPLTARVIVNRIWQQYFGRGLVETENDFGTQGSPPSHPELLDWIACELMQPAAPATPWSLKHIHRLIVTSAAYRQSSKVRPDLAIVDPNNKLLARQNRLRLDAEIVRDIALASSGLLNARIGGPSVFPPQPDGVMNLGQSRREWKPSNGPDRYRRGMYTFFWRATPHPALMVFDSADGFSTCTRRLRSNTPLQALTVLNDGAFFEFAQALAARVLKEGPRSDAERIDFAFRLCLARTPQPAERQRLLKVLNQERAMFDASPIDATTGMNTKADPKLNARDVAAWTTVARVLLNLDETITRE